MASVHNQLPLNYGGPVARRGFVYQDYVAVQFCVHSVTGVGPREVWCELLDDITLIWENENGDEPEFVQVKSTRLHSLWSVASICSRESHRRGTSMVEKSLANDTCDELSRFRFITASDIAQELRVLHSELGCAERLDAHAPFKELCRKLEKQLPGVTSNNGTTPTEWARRLTWTVEGRIEDVYHKTLALLTRYLFEAHGVSAPDQVEEVHDLLQREVFRAGQVDARNNLDGKKLKRQTVLRQIATKVTQLKNPSRLGPDRLRRELINTGFSEVDIDDLMQSFAEQSARSRVGGYYQLVDFDAVDSAIRRTLRRLRLRYESGQLNDTPLQFHNRCLDELDEVRRSLVGEGLPGEEYFEYRLYDLVQRGFHRFTKVARDT